MESYCRLRPFLFLPLFTQVRGRQRERGGGYEDAATYLGLDETHREYYSQRIHSFEGCAQIRPSCIIGRWGNH